MRRLTRLLPLLFTGTLAVPAAATDVALPGKSLTLRARTAEPAKRLLVWKTGRGERVGAPLPDPTGGASLFLFSSNAPDGCRATIELPGAGFEPVRGDPARGWRYRDPSGAADGIRKVTLRTGSRGGRLAVRGRGPLPCALDADVQPEPFHLALRIGDTRYCSTFGGSVRRNRAGRFEARRADAGACPEDDVTAATLNVLHGLLCPEPTARCRLEDRFDLLGAFLAARGCPSVVALQEVFVGADVSMVELAESTLADVCAAPYRVLYQVWNVFDDTLLLTRHRALAFEVVPLHNGFRHALYARVDHPTGPLDLVATHLASGSDSGASPCDQFQPCPPECVAAGAATVRDCQAEQVAGLLEARHDALGPALAMGDLNAEPGSFVHAAFTGRGWLDAPIAVGLPECDPATGLGCTSGREDEDLVDLESPDRNQDRRIDFLFVVPPGPDAGCAGLLDGPLDDDGDGVATRHFADEPNPFAASCGPAPDPVCWVSDHGGVQVDVNCAP